MIGIFVFQRYGVIVPIALLAMGLLVEYVVDNKFGDGYYGSSGNHIWTFGVVLTLSGIIISLMAYYVDDNRRNRDGLPSYDSLLLDDGGNSDGSGSNNNSKLNWFNPTFTTSTTTTMKENIRDFVMEPSTNDHFCYVPMNYCGLGLLGCGIVLIFVGLVFA